MLRVVLLNLLMFALPFIGYALWLRTPGGRNATWRDAPFVTLFGVSVVMVVVTMGIVISFGGFGTDTHYVPAVFEDGVLKPGRSN